MKVNDYEGLRFEAELASRNFQVAFDAQENQVTAVLGHNGSGKSTLLEILAGIIRPDSGYAKLGRHVLFDLPAGNRPGIWTPPYKRNSALLSQDPLLFPHMTVLDNVAYGLRIRGARRTEARREALRWLNRMGCGDLAGSRATALSGGQAQRISIARAAATQPSLLLLDEPMAALDVQAAPEVRQALQGFLTDKLALLVTHDSVDAATLSQRALVLEQGRLVEDGLTGDVLNRPRTLFAADLAGVNLVRGRYSGEAVVTGAGLAVAGQAAPGVTLAKGVGASATFSPTAVAVYLDFPAGSPRNHWRARIESMQPHHGLVRLSAVTSGTHVVALITTQAVAELGLAIGMEVILVVKATQVTIYPS